MQKIVECEFFIIVKKLWNYCWATEQQGKPGDDTGVNEQQTSGNVQPKKCLGTYFWSIAYLRGKTVKTKCFPVNTVYTKKICHS